MEKVVRKPLLQRLGKEWLFFDGGTGSILQEKGLKGGELPERWNLTRPEDIIDLHCGYLKAGCDIFNTNTFGANALKFPGPGTDAGTEEHGELRRIIETAVALAKEAICSPWETFLLRRPWRSSEKSSGSVPQRARIWF